MAKKTTDKKLFNKYIDKVKGLKKDKNIEAIYSSLLNGKNSYLRLSRKGSSSFDPSWIDVIEDCLYDLGEIISHPREVTKIESNVTPIELAKKVDGESVQHLASHTQFIKEIDEKGDVVPSKILSHSNVEDIHTYENRFIATFVRQLVLFIEKRYEFIKSNLNLTNEEVFFVKNKSVVNGQEVEIESKVTIKKDSQDRSAVDARDYIERIKTMREYVTYYYNSPFMKMMKTEKNVRRPILQTNIIRKNPKYHKCYEAFLFIERFDSLGVSYKVNENYQELNEEERKRINYLLLSDFLSVQGEDPYESIKKTEKTYKPKILTSIDDEKFTYGDILKGPIEFVRIDEIYRQYLLSKIKGDLPEHPDKHEREYYKEEYDYKNEAKMDEKEIEKLIARKQKEIDEYELLIAELIKERDYEEAEEKARELDALRKYQNDLISIRRKKIIDAAINYVSDEEFKFNSDRLPEYKDDTMRDSEIVFGHSNTSGPIIREVQQNAQFKQYLEDNSLEEAVLKQEGELDNSVPYAGANIAKEEIRANLNNEGILAMPINSDLIPDEEALENNIQQENNNKENTPVEVKEAINHEDIALEAAEERHNEEVAPFTSEVAAPLVMDEEVYASINEEQKEAQPEENVPPQEEHVEEEPQIEESSPVEENKQEEKPVEEVAPIEEPIKEEKPVEKEHHREPVVYYVLSESETRIVDGHKETVILVKEDNEEDNSSKNEQKSLEEPKNSGE